MNININHNWELAPKEAVQLQRKLSLRVKLSPLKKKVRYIAGADMSISLFSKVGFGGFVVLKFPELTPVETSIIKDNVNFPYIPGLLSFREIPTLLKAWAKLNTKPDLIMVDGAGIAHPRRLGIASHLGILLSVPTIGCAKSLLTGHYKEPQNQPGSFSYLFNDSEEVIGAALRTKKNVMPMLISPGHKITLEESIELVLESIRKHRLPEPTRLAHNAVNEYRIKDL